MNTLLFASLVSLGVASRLLPHPANFTAVGAIAMFLAWRLPKGLGFAAPLAIMFVSDLALGFYDWRLTLAVYGSMAVMGFFGRWIGRRPSFSAARTAAGAFGASLFFYLTTNFAVWVFGPWYPRTAAGLLHSYVLALPFFRNSLLGDMFFAFVLFGAYACFRARAHTSSFLHARPLDGQGIVESPT